MKRKLLPKPETVVPAEILEHAKLSISSDHLEKSDEVFGLWRRNRQFRQRAVVLGLPPSQGQRVARDRAANARAGIASALQLSLMLRAGVSELADEPDSKSGGVHSPCGFKSHLRHH